MPNNIIITGEPHSGKSTLLADVVGEIQGAYGFLTREIAEGGVRVGFELVTHADDRILLAHTSEPKKGPAIRFGRYYVRLKELDKMIEGLKLFKPHDILYIDEIGSMQCFSLRFQRFANLYLGARNLCIAAVSSVSEHPYPRRVIQNGGKSHYGFITVTEQNREESRERLTRLVRYAQLNRL